MNRWIEFDEQYILNSDEIKYFHIDENKENITIVLKDGKSFNLTGSKLETAKTWEKILKSCDIDPPYWIYEELYGFETDEIGDM